MIDKCGTNNSKLFHHLNELLGRNLGTSTLPDHTSKHSLTNEFKEFFVEKIDRIVADFTVSNYHIEILIPDMPVEKLQYFAPVTLKETLGLIRKINKTYSLNDSIDNK